jgi:outer membrane protein TolC
MADKLCRRVVLSAAVVAACCVPVRGQGPAVSAPRSGSAPNLRQAEPLPGAPPVVATDAVQTYHLSLAEAKSRVLETSIVMELASSQVAAKCFALEAARKDFLPKLLNSFTYFHFDSDLGTVVTTPGIFNPATAVTVPIVNQDAPLFSAVAIQPITPLMKVKAAVEIGEAEVGAAQAQRQLARRELTKGVEQLYIGLWAARKIKGGLELAVAGAKQMVDATHSSDAKISLVEVQQNLVPISNQCIVLQTQLNQLTGLPPCTELSLEDPPAPLNPFVCADEVVSAALASSPKIREARMQVEKAAGAVRLAHADYVPSVNTYGFYVNQETTPTIQDSFTGVGMSASYLLEWGKKNDTLRQWKATEVLARQALQKEIQDLQLNAIKAYNDVGRTEQALTYANDLATLNREAKLPMDPFQLKFAVKDRLEAELGAIKADLDYRTAVVEVRSIAGYCE